MHVLSEFDNEVSLLSSVYIFCYGQADIKWGLSTLDFKTTRSPSKIKFSAEIYWTLCSEISWLVQS